MTAVSDYIGRRVDMAAFHGQTPTGSVLLTQALAEDGTSGRLLTGVARLGQRILLEFLTKRGSIPFLPARGSTFMTELHAGGIRTPANLLGAVSRALIDVRRNLAAEETAEDSLDEKLGSVTAESVALVNGNAVVKLVASSQDPAARVILPIEVSIR